MTKKIKSEDQNIPIDDFEGRKRIVMELVDQFRIERYVYMIISVISFLALLVLALYSIANGQMTAKEFMLLFAPTAIMGYAITRILYMWTKSMQIIFTGKF